jgi:hypothetical protein
MKKIVSFVYRQKCMYMHVAVFCIAFCISVKLKASDLFMLAGARDAGLANSTLALESTWSVFHNPAGMAGLTTFSFGLNYESRFAITQLQTSSFASTMPVRFGSFGLAGSYFGSTLYNEQKYAFGYARSFAGKIKVGMLCDYFSVNLPEGYDNAQALAGELGLIAHPIENLNIACHIFNLTGSKFNTSYAELPVTFTTGAAWVSKNYLVSTQIQIPSNEKPELSVGSELTIVRNLAVRLGVSTLESMSYTVGIGFNPSRISVDLALAHHPVLGYSTFFTLEFHGIQHKR